MRVGQDQLMDCGGLRAYIDERFLRCEGRLLRRSEGGEKASVHFGRNDRWCWVVSWMTVKIGFEKQIPHPQEAVGSE